ncbi:MAG: hypothetical protein H0W90_03960 [Actinobacteria bacterium]|nr:hypothetical protein [Actinomycetota bacterium]
MLFFKAPYPTARVVACEPAAPAYELLRRNVEQNALADVGQLLVEYHHHLDGERDFVGLFAERLRDQGSATRSRPRRR